jgi:hypothetical protein
MKTLTTLMSVTLSIAFALSGCKGDESKPQSEATSESPPAVETTSSDPTQPAATTDAPPASELDRLLAWMPGEPHAVSYDRLKERLDPEVLEVVFGIPPKAGHLLDERGNLDEAFALVFEGEGETSKWLAPPSFSFTISLSRSPYFLRLLSKPAAEVAPLLVSAGFTKNTIDGVEVWLPSGSFPWRIALLEGDVVAFIPIDVPGAGLEPLLQGRQAAAPVEDAGTASADETGAAPAEDTGAAPAEDASAAKAVVEAELRRALTDDPMIELVLISSGPLVHFDVDQSIAQVQFALRRIAANAPGYEGQIVLMPVSDPDECANDLRARKHPEENQQVQALLAAVEFSVIEGAVIGRLAISPDQLKHFLLR